jgi:hypothetical protein
MEKDREQRILHNDRVSRRSAIKTLGLAAGAMTLPAKLAASASELLHARAGTGSSSQPRVATNPKWYGFNLLEYFSTDPDWMKYFPYKDDGMFQEDDFRWMRDWGFNWVRLPMDYRFWTDPQDFHKIYEDKVLLIDRAIKLGDKYGFHVNVSLHRAPGYCILDTLDDLSPAFTSRKKKRASFPIPRCSMRLSINGRTSRSGTKAFPAIS